MQFLDLTLASIEENVALDEALLLWAEEGKCSRLLRIWEWSNLAVVLGAACRLAEDVKESVCDDDGVPIVRRSSGGGTVLLGKGCLLYTLVLPFESEAALRDVKSSYIVVLDRICDALTDLVPGLHRDGISDLVVGDRKVSGNAQRRKRTYMLHHGSLLYDFDIALVERYLHMPPRQPDYREDRSHEAFLTNLQVDRRVLIERLRIAWNASVPLSDWPQEKTLELTRDKPTQEHLIRRR